MHVTLLLQAVMSMHATLLLQAVSGDLLCWLLRISLSNAHASSLRSISHCYTEIPVPKVKNGSVCPKKTIFFSVPPIIMHVSVSQRTMKIYWWTHQHAYLPVICKWEWKWLLMLGQWDPCQSCCLKRAQIWPRKRFRVHFSVWMNTRTLPYGVNGKCSHNLIPSETRGCTPSLHIHRMPLWYPTRLLSPAHMHSHTYKLHTHTHILTHLEEVLKWLCEECVGVRLGGGAIAECQRFHTLQRIYTDVLTETKG